MKIFILGLFLFLCFTGVKAQDSKEIDSLTKIIGTLKDDTIKVNALNTLSWDQCTVQEYKISLKYSQQALELAKNLRFDYGIARAYLNIGCVLQDTGNVIEAIRYFEDAINICKDSNRKIFLAYLYQDLGSAFHVIQNETSALENDLKAIQLIEQYGEKADLASLYNNVSSIYGYMSQDSLCRKYLFDALAIYEGLKEDNLELGACLTTVADYFSGKGNYAEAFKYNERASKVCLEHNYRNVMVYVYQNFGKIYFNQNKYKNAIVEYKKSLSLARELGMKNEQSFALKFITFCYYSLNQFDSSEQTLMEAIRIAKECGSAINLGDDYEIWSTLDSAKGDYKSALVHFKRSKSIMDSIFNHENQNKITRLSMQYDYDIKRVQDKNEFDKKEIMQAAMFSNTKLKRDIIIGVLAIVILIGGMVYYINRQRNKLNLHQQVSQVEMKALRAQMNPHFIFNSLNSIYNYIQVKNNHSASGFLIRFSGLIRMILENSMSPVVTLEEEISCLKLFLSLESERFDHRFNYNFLINEEINPDKLLIPPMILQPYIENSIWHGMQNIHGEGMIEVRIDQSGNLLKCTITDNGPGLSTERKTIRKSYGTSITEQRLKLLNDIGNGSGKVMIQNRSEEELGKTGVRVEIDIPVEYA